MKSAIGFLASLAFLLTSCTPPPATATLTQQGDPISTLVSELLRQTPSPSPTAAPSKTPTPTPTLGPYDDLTIANLAARSYGEGELLNVGELERGAGFTRYLIGYPSDNLTINGFLNLPVGEGPFPVVIVLHGYVNPATYQVQTYTTRYADAFAQAGYLVIHPNYRNHPPSDSGANLFRVGYAIDVLNLVALVRRQAGQAGLLEKANPHAIGLWGHSMGGGIALRVVTVANPEARVDAAVLYGSMSGDDRQNFEHIYNVLSDKERGFEELSVPIEALLSISPIHYLERIDTPLSVHHGEADDQVPAEWSQDLCARLEELGKMAECFFYPEQDHTFNGWSDRVLIDRTLDFFERYLR